MPLYLFVLFSFVAGSDCSILDDFSAAAKIFVGRTGRYPREVPHSQTPSGPPRNVEATANSNIIRLTWQAPVKPEGSNMVYYIQFAEVDQSGFTNGLEVLSREENITFSLLGMKPMTSYKCSITAYINPGVGQQSSPLLIVSTKDGRGSSMLTLDPPEDSIVVYPNSEFTISCSGDGDKETNITWMLEGGEEISGELLKMRAPAVSTFATCRGVSAIGTATRDIEIIVNEPPQAPEKFEGIPDVTKIKLMWCAPERFGRTTTLSYQILYAERDAKPANIYRVNTVRSSERDVSYTFNNLKPNITYKYLITAKNEFGEGPKSSLLVVSTAKERYPPTLTLEPASRQLTVQPEQNVTLKCTADGEPQPKLKWVLDGKQEISGGTLHLTAASENITAVCYGENSEGKSSREIKIIVNVPRSSFELGVLERDDDVNITWKPPKHSGTRTHYIVYLTADNPREFKLQHFLVEDMAQPMLQFFAGELLPDTNYSVEVSAVNLNGNRLRSESRTFTIH